MKAPAFWSRPDSLPGRLLSPLGWLYAETTAWRLAHGRPWTAPIPVVCVGNLTAGGAGKTPIVRDLASRLRAAGRNPAVLSRGYGGREHGPLLVDPARHSAAEVGDEPLLLAGDGPCWIAADRAAGALAIVRSGAGVIVMDDGLQNPGLTQTLRLIVIDGGEGFGNGRAIPAGPLRERVTDGLGRADAVIVLGEDRCSALSRVGATPILRARLTPSDADALRGVQVVAFAGIGRPEKFRVTLTEAGALIVGFHAFPDHHPYRLEELERLAAEAGRLNATAVTTEKDWVRLDPAWRERITPARVSVAWSDGQAVDRLLDRLVFDG